MASRGGEVPVDPANKYVLRDTPVDPEVRRLSLVGADYDPDLTQQIAGSWAWSRSTVP